MRRQLLALTCACLLGMAVTSSAQAAFGDYAIESASSSLSSYQAGDHADFASTFVLAQEANGSPSAQTRDVEVTLPPGLFGNPQAFPHCTALQLGINPEFNECPRDLQVGIVEVSLYGQGTLREPLFNMTVPGGDIVARFGFFAGLYPLTINARVDPKDEYRITASLEGAPALAEPTGATTTVWAVPSSPVHDEERMTPQEASEGKPPPVRHSSLPQIPFLTNPTRCGVPLEVGFAIDSYQEPGAVKTKTATMPALSGCGSVDFNPQVESSPTTEEATTGSGLDYGLALPTKGLEFPNLLYDSEARRAEVILPEGMSVNPSEAEGLGVCSEAELAREAYDSPPGAGCPETSKIGSVIATTPVLDRKAEGSLYLAKPYANPFGSLLALYMVLKIPDRGVLVTLAGKVTTDPASGRLTTVFDDVPQLPVASFALHFREGARAPLVTPPGCGTYRTLSYFSPWSAPANPFLRESPFSITTGPDHGPCPTGGLPPFKPGLLAGTLNNRAGSFSSFDVRLTRTDSEQEITHFSIKLPPGLVAKLAGVPLCPDAAISAAKARTGIHGGEEELGSPSCPTASQVGTSLAGAGVGSVLVYVPGKVYLAGPYHGSALSVVAVTAAKAGPFDLGTVVVREALRVNPETGEVFVDATGSDPIPHIIAGVPVRLRDIRVYVDKPEFVLNPTDCTRTSTASTVLGAGLDFSSEADDRPVTVSSPFQAADCAALPFAPKLSLRLIGGTKRGAHPALHAHLLMHGIGEAGVARSGVTLPHSEFIENAHFNTICTRAQFKEGAVPGERCPAGSVYGHAKAVTPILDEPLEGPVFLRSSEHQLPDVVAALHSGKIDVVLDGRVDSVKGKLRTTFESVPDAPVSSFDLDLFGKSKGLFVNSTNLCRGAHRAEVGFTGQNGKTRDFKAPLRAKCPKSHRRRGPKRRG